MMIGMITINHTNFVYPFRHKIFKIVVTINMIINFKRDVS